MPMARHVSTSFGRAQIQHELFAPLLMFGEHVSSAPEEQGNSEGVMQIALAAFLPSLRPPAGEARWLLHLQIPNQAGTILTTLLGVLPGAAGPPRGSCREPAGAAGRAQRGADAQGDHPPRLAALHAFSTIPALPVVVQQC